MAAGRDYYAIERLAHRDGYTVLKDVDGKVLSSSDGAEYWPDCPPELETSLPFDDIWRRWKENATNTPSLCDADIRPSTHAGHYLCDFLYYCCLADNQRRKRDNKAIAEVDKRPVIFLQVPADAAPADIRKGQELTVSLLRALADSYAAAKRSGASRERSLVAWPKRVESGGENSSFSLLEGRGVGCY